MALYMREERIIEFEAIYIAGREVAGAGELVYHESSQKKPGNYVNLQYRRQGERLCLTLKRRIGTTLKYYANLGEFHLVVSPEDFIYKRLGLAIRNAPPLSNRYSNFTRRYEVVERSRDLFGELGDEGGFDVIQLINIGRHAQEDQKALCQRDQKFLSFKKRTELTFIRSLSGPLPLSMRIPVQGAVTALPVLPPLEAVKLPLPAAGAPPPLKAVKLPVDVPEVPPPLKAVKLLVEVAGDLPPLKAVKLPVQGLEAAKEEEKSEEKWEGKEGKSEEIEFEETMPEEVVGVTAKTPIEAALEAALEDIFNNTPKEMLADLMRATLDFRTSDN